MLVSFFIRVISLTYPVLVSFFIGGVSLTHLVLASFLSGDFLLHIPCWLHVSVGSFSYTSRAGLFFFFFSFFFFMWGSSLVCSLFSRHPLKKRAGWKMAQKKSEKVTLKTEKEPYNTLYRAEQNQTRVSLTHPLLASLCGAFLLHILCWLPYVGSFFMCHVEIFLHILCWLLFVWSFSYMYCASFFMWRVSLTHTMLAALCGLFLLHFHARFFMFVVSLTHPLLAS